MALFQKKNPQKVCQFQKKHYLCIRIQGNASKESGIFEQTEHRRKQFFLC
jgi:hypothetical protein